MTDRASYMCRLPDFDVDVEVLALRGVNHAGDAATEAVQYQIDLDPAFARHVIEEGVAVLVDGEPYLVEGKQRLDLSARRGGR